MRRAESERHGLEKAAGTLTASGTQTCHVRRVAPRIQRAMCAFPMITLVNKWGQNGIRKSLPWEGGLPDVMIPAIVLFLPARQGLPRLYPCPFMPDDATETAHRCPLLQHHLASTVLRCAECWALALGVQASQCPLRARPVFCPNMTSCMPT